MTSNGRRALVFAVLALALAGCAPGRDVVAIERTQAVAARAAAAVGARRDARAAGARVFHGAVAA